MNTELVDRLVQFAVLCAGRNDDWQERSLGPIHIIKNVYLADLACSEKDGTTATGAEWTFYHFGPWNVQVNSRIQPALSNLGADYFTVASKFETDSSRWRLRDEHVYRRLEGEIPLRASSAIKKAVKEYGCNTSRLLSYVYTTQPMLAARPGQKLVFKAKEQTPPSPPSDPVDKLSTKQAKRRKERLEAVRAEVQRKLNGPPACAPQAADFRQPRYDDVYEQGVAWLDSLAGEPPALGKMEVIFDDSVWEGEGPRTDERS